MYRKQTGRLAVIPWLLLAAVCQAQRLIYVDFPVKDPKQRARLEAATTALTQGPRTIAAVETLVGFFGRGVVVYFHTGTVHMLKDKTAIAGYNALREFYPLDFLARVLDKGSENAAYWALGRILQQHWSSGTTMEWTEDGEDVEVQSEDAKALAAMGGLLDEKGKATVRAAVLRAEKTRGVAIRDFAIRVIDELGLVEDWMAFLRPRLKDPSARVVATALRQLTRHLCRRRPRERQLDAWV